MLEYRPVDLHKRHFPLPGSLPGRRIVHRELVADGIVAGPGEALGDLDVLAGAAERNLVVEIRGLDHESVAFPVAFRIAEPRTHVGRSMGPAVGGNDTGLVQHLGENRDVARALDDLIGRVVGGRHHRRARRSCRRNATRSGCSGPDRIGPPASVARPLDRRLSSGPLASPEEAFRSPGS